MNNFYFSVNSFNNSIIIMTHKIVPMLATENGKSAIEILQNFCGSAVNISKGADGFTTFKVNVGLEQVKGILLHFGGIESLSEDFVPQDAVRRQAWNTHINNRRDNMKRKAQRY